MSKHAIRIAACALVGLLALGSGGCIEEKVIEVILSSETSAEFEHGPSAAEIFEETRVVIFDEVIEDAMEDAGYGREDISNAIFLGSDYGVDAIYSDGHDWLISGEITVQRTGPGADGPVERLIIYTEQSLMDALGQRLPAQLDSDGVAVINAALADYVAGTNDVELTFTMNNADCDPNPSEGDQIHFDWVAWLNLQVMLTQTLDVPDPF